MCVCVCVYVGEEVVWKACMRRKRRRRYRKKIK